MTLDRAQFRAEFGTPEAVALDAGRLRVTAQLRNSSRRAWPAAGPVRLAYQILDGDTGVLLIDGQRQPLPADLPPGGEARAEISVQLPPEDGLYRVLVSPVEDNVAWFFEQGSDCLAVDAEISGDQVAVRQCRRSTAAARSRERLGRVLARAIVYPFATIRRNRSLIVSMVRRDIHGRYRGSVAGLFWTVIQPLLMMLTYFFIFALVLGVRWPGASSGPASFLLNFTAGMLPWLAFSEALGRASNVVLDHRTLVKRVVFPLEILPVNLALAGLVSEFFGLLVFLAAVGVFQGHLPVTAAWLPVILVPQILLTLGLCWFLAALGVFLRDTGQFMAFLLTLWFFATPICYPESALPENLRGVFALNPVYLLVRSYRAVFLEGRPPDFVALGWLTAVAFAVFLLGFAWFYKAKRAFADVL
jgi:lipopolysaccharide transport system permease protein